VVGFRGCPAVRCAAALRDELCPQLTALFTSSPIFFSSAAVNSFSANEVGHIEPLSRLAESVKPKVAYLASNFCAL
jgi:hypothetical protein